MKNIKKLCLYLSLFVITLLFNKNIAKADIVPNYIFNYDTNYFNTQYSSDLFDKLSDLKTYIDENNTYNRDYIIYFNNYSIQVQIFYNCDVDYSIFIYIPKVRDGRDYLTGPNDLSPYCNSGTATSNNISISYSDFNNDNTSTFYNTIALRLVNASGSSIPTYFGATNLRLNNSNFYVFDNMNYSSNSSSSTIIYYSTSDIYFGKKPKQSGFNNQPSISTYCSPNYNYTTNFPIYNANYIYEDSNGQTSLSCGDEYITYMKFKEDSTPQYYLHEDYGYINKQIDSIDFYYFHYLDTAIEEYIEIQETMTDTSSNNYNVSGYKVLGKKCNGGNGINENKGTCWWEEINNNYWNVSSDSYTMEDNIYTINFKFNLDVSSENYKVVKLAVQQKPSNFNLKIFTKDENGTKYQENDINTMRWDYCKEWIHINNNVVGIYTTNKPEYDNIEYRFYTKRNREQQLISFYNFNKSKNEITNSRLESLIYKTYYLTTNNIQYWIETGTINLGTNYPNNLYIFNTYGINQADIITPYFNTQVYYVMQENITEEIIINYTGDNNNIQTTIKTLVNNEFIQTEFDNSTSVDFDKLTEIIEEYKQYKEEWLLLFNNIYIHFPTIIKHILQLAYFLLHCYGVFLIFKD